MNIFKKIIQKNKELNETIKMAKSISEQHEKEPTKVEMILGWVGSIIFYGVSIWFLLYMILKGVEKYTR
ncbi:hypothetical protein [Sulfurimonas sp.]